MPEAIYSTLAEFYDRVYGTKDYSREAAWVLSVARREMGRAPRSLLDVGCGTGRHLAVFRRSLDVAGVDRSPEMLRIARRRLGPGVPLVRGDMARFDARRSFDVVVCLFSAFAYLQRREEREATAANFYRHLEPGGVALVEGWVRSSRWRAGAIHLQTYDGDDAKLARLSVARRDGNDSLIEMQYLAAEPGGRIRHVAETHRMCLLEPSEMLAPFRLAGFRVKALFSGPYRARGLFAAVRPLERGASGGTKPTVRRRRSPPKRGRPH
ncbi:MAG: class I SAM-dependent methyltransferase [Thermoplasmata archaeon]